MGFFINYTIFICTIFWISSHSIWCAEKSDDGLDNGKTNTWVKIVYGNRALDSWDKDSDRVGLYSPHHPEHQDYDHQLWKIVSVGNGLYTISSKYAEKNLDCWNKDIDRVGKFVPHPPIHEHYNHQLWRIKKVYDTTKDSNGLRIPFYTVDPRHTPEYIIISEYSGKALERGLDGDQICKGILYSQNNRHSDNDQWRINSKYPEHVNEVHYSRQLWDIVEPSWTEYGDGNYY